MGGAGAMSYRSIGLSRNPFATEPCDDVPDGLWADRGLPEAPPAAPGSLVEVVGASGAGKTSHLVRWARILEAPYHYTPPGPRRWQVPRRTDVLLWDEADRAPWPVRRLVWWRTRRRGGTVVISGHRSLAGEARRAGLSPTTFELGSLGLAHLAAWARRRVAAAALDGMPAWVEDLPLAVVAATAGASLVEAADLLHVEVARLARESARVERRLRQPRAGRRHTPQPVDSTSNGPRSSLTYSQTSTLPPS